jgi:HK97 gp10 family phage protein
MKFKIDVRGIDALVNEIANIKEEMLSELEAATVEGAEVFVGIAKANSPSRTGNLREAHKIKKLPRKDKYPATTLAGVDYNMAPQAHLVEYGTGGRSHDNGKRTGAMPASGYFRKSMDQAKPAVQQIIIERVRGVIDRAGKGKTPTL